MPLLPMRIIMKFSPSVHPEAENDTEEYANRTLSVDPSVFYRFICRRQSVSRYMGNHRINVNPSFYERRKRRHAPCEENDGEDMTHRMAVPSVDGRTWEVPVMG